MFLKTKATKKHNKLSFLIYFNWDKIAHIESFEKINDKYALQQQQNSYIIFSSDVGRVFLINVYLFQILTDIKSILLEKGISHLKYFLFLYTFFKYLVFEIVIV